jgi:ribonuclease T1
MPRPAPHGAVCGTKAWAGAVAVKVGLLIAATLPLQGLARSPDSPAGVPGVALTHLPAEARDTHRLILAGGPFPYRKDGTVFGNRERLLPLNPRGHYREYTVKTPGSRDRGARRIVCGGREPAAPVACYYTADHYSSFKRIVTP